MRKPFLKIYVPYNVEKKRPVGVTNRFLNEL
jgi:hypothetical protein